MMENELSKLTETLAENKSQETKFMRALKEVPEDFTSRAHLLIDSTGIFS